MANNRVIPIAAAAALPLRERKRRGPKGRRPTDEARAEVRAVLGEASRQRDLLIEHLHKLQDHFGHLSAAHLTALADEMRLAQTEVYEVASFYHHFDIVKEGDEAPQALTVRVCDGLSCELAGAQQLLAKLPAMLGREVRVIAAPCIGRCEQAPAAVVGQNPVPCATAQKVAEKVREGAVTHEPEGYIGLSQYRAAGGYAVLEQCLNGTRDVEAVISSLEAAGPTPSTWYRSGLGPPGPVAILLTVLPCVVAARLSSLCGRRKYESRVVR